MIGNCCYAYFQYCDPWKNGWIAERDQGTGSNHVLNYIPRTKDGNLSVGLTDENRYISFVKKLRPSTELWFVAYNMLHTV